MSQSGQMGNSSSLEVSLGADLVDRSTMMAFEPRASEPDEGPLTGFEGDAAREPSPWRQRVMLAVASLFDRDYFA